MLTVGSRVKAHQDKLRGPMCAVIGLIGSKGHIFSPVHAETVDKGQIVFLAVIEILKHEQNLILLQRGKVGFRLPGFAAWEEAHGLVTLRAAATAAAA